MQAESHSCGKELRAKRGNQYEYEEKDESQSQFGSGPVGADQTKANQENPCDNVSGLRHCSQGFVRSYYSAEPKAFRVDACRICLLLQRRPNS